MRRRLEGRSGLHAWGSSGIGAGRNGLRSRTVHQSPQSGSRTCVISGPCRVGEFFDRSGHSRRFDCIRRCSLADTQPLLLARRSAPNFSQLRVEPTRILHRLTAEVDPNPPFNGGFCDGPHSSSDDAGQSLRVSSLARRHKTTLLLRRTRRDAITLRETLKSGPHPISALRGIPAAVASLGS